MPTAPAADTIGISSAIMVRPPLSWRMTAWIHFAGTLNLRDACATSPSQRCISWDGDIACSLVKTEGLAGAVAVTGGGAGLESREGGETCPACCNTTITAKMSPPDSIARATAGRASRAGAETVLIRNAAAELTSTCLPDKIVPLSMRPCGPLRSLRPAAKWVPLPEQIPCPRACRSRRKYAGTYKRKCRREKQKKRRGPRRNRSSP